MSFHKWIFLIVIFCVLIQYIRSANIPSNLKPMRVTLDFSQIEKSFVNTDQKQYIKMIFTLFSSFLSQLFYVQPRTSVIKNGGLLYCRDTYIGMDGIKGYKDTDLVIVVSATNTVFDDFRVRYNFCKWDNRPIMMEARFQMRKFVKNPVHYEVTELKRAFMYNGMWNTDNLGYWVDYTTGSTYSSTNQFYQKIKVNGVNKYFLTGKHIKEVVQTHFNCPTAVGLEVESNNYMSNYIPDDLYNNEVIRDYQNRLFSQFDVAIIKDMGVYEYVNEDLAEEIIWGKNQGCDVLTNICGDIYKDTIEADNTLYQCTQFKNSKYIKPKSEVDSLVSKGSCPRITQTNSVSCLDLTQSNSFTEKLGELFGSQSKCFESNVFNRTVSEQPHLISAYIHKNSPIRCHYIECIADTINIVFALNQKVTCNLPNQIVTVDTKDFVGSIKCPTDFSIYCEKKFCPNDCSGAGFCNNGVCNCVEGRYGEDCSIICPSGQTNCKCKLPCSNCQKSDDQCTACIDGYKLAFGQNKCEQICDSTCLTCSKSRDPYFCTSCEFGQVLIQGQCLPCVSPCKRCINKVDECTACIDNYKLNTNTSKCEPICDYSCKSCLLPLNINSCTSCFSGYYLTEFGNCEKCDFNCKECVGDGSICSDCFNNYYLDNPTSSCIPRCTQNCLTCTIPLDQNSCLTCDQGFFLKDGRCLDCIQSANEYEQTIPDECQNIVTSNNCGKYCMQCLVSDTNSCVKCISKNTVGVPSCICDNEFHFINRVCTECDKREYFDNTLTKCQPCHDSCVSCFGSSQYHCSSCNDLGYQYLDTKTKQCLCMDPERSMIYNSQLGRYTCELGMIVLFSRYEETRSLPIYQQFQAKFSQPLSTLNLASENIFNTFTFQISETPSDYYNIQVDRIFQNTIVFSIVNFYSFSADILMITIKNTTFISSSDGRYIQQSQLFTQQKLDIGPLFLANNKKEDPMNNSFNQALNFISYNENIKSAITFLNQFSIFLYFLNTIQPSALLILINTNYPNVLYQFERIFAIFIFEDVPDQSIIRSEKKCSMTILYTIDFCDQDALNKVEQDKFERLGMSYSFPINTGKVLNQFMLFFLLYLISAYITAFRKSPHIILSPLRRSLFEQKNKMYEIANKLTGKAYSLFFSTLEANILLISISAHLQLRTNIIQHQDLLLVRLSIYCYVIFIVLLVFLMRSAHKSIENNILEDFSSDIRSDGNYFCKYFHYINLFKKWIVCAAHVELYYYPSTLIQFVIAVYSFFVVLTAIFKPFKNFVANLQRVIGDCLFIFIYICVLQIHNKSLVLKKNNKIDDHLLNNFDTWGLITCYSLLSYNLLYLMIFLFNSFNKLYPYCKKKNPQIQFINVFLYSSQNEQNSNKTVKSVKPVKKDIKKQLPILHQNNQKAEQADLNILSPMEISIDSFRILKNEKKSQFTYPQDSDERKVSIMQHLNDSQCNTPVNENKSKKQIKQQVIQLTEDFTQIKSNNKISTFGFPITNHK